MTNLAQLQAEIHAAGITAAICRLGGIIYLTNPDNGALVPLDDAASIGVDVAALQAVIAAHVPIPPPEKIDLGADVADDQGDRMAEAVTTLRAYLNAASPTAAQSAAALKLLIRVVLFLLKRHFGY